MSDHDRSHPQWETPPAGPQQGPEPGAPAPATSEAAPAHEAAEVPPTGRSGRRRRPALRRPTTRLGKGLVAAAVGLSLVFGGGAAGVALADGGGPDRGGAVPTAEDGGGRGGDGPRGGRGD